MAMTRTREGLEKELIIKGMGIQAAEKRLLESIQKNQGFLSRIYERELRKRQKEYREIESQLKEMYEDKMTQDIIDDRM